MRKLLSCLLLLPLMACADNSNKSTTAATLSAQNAVSNPASTYVFMVGVLKWQSPTLSPFSNRNRKDEELYNLLLSKGVKKTNTVFLKDNEATLPAIKQRMKELLGRTTADSRFIFYYAGHGVRGGNGPVCFANYNYSSGNGFAASTVSEMINAAFKGNEVWLLADCCYSGTLLEEAKKINNNNRKVLAFTSSTSSNISTANWTFTQTMIDCLGGLGIGDRNADGKITLAETKDELYDAMLFRERQMSGTVFYNLPESTTFNLSAVQGKAGTPVSYVYVQQNGKFEPLRIITKTGNNINGELYHYSDKVPLTIDASKTKPIEYMEYPVGKKAGVEWNGKTYPAEVLKVQNGFHYIRYTGYDDSWNEWVMYNRIYTPERKKCMIEWQGQWYPGETLQQKNGKHFVHYTGYGNDWDEWVAPERIKL